MLIIINNYIYVTWIRIKLFFLFLFYKITYLNKCKWCIFETRATLIDLFIININVCIIANIIIWITFKDDKVFLLFVLEKYKKVVWIWLFENNTIFYIGTAILEIILGSRKIKTF